MNEEIRTRIAPSPTGLLHLGTARTALFNWLYAKKYAGKFILRIEDTDKARSTEESLLDITDGLSWLGLGWDEGPETPDLSGPYRQSQRLAIYKKSADFLLQEKRAYHCYCTIEELAAERKAQEASHQPPKYSGKCRSLTSEQIEKYRKEGRQSTLRFRIDETEPVKFKDLIHGEMEFDPKLFGDIIIVKSDGMPTFMFAGVVDDAAMKITHVIRGEDHLSNTPKQILLGQALNLPIPEYAHLPMILNEDRTKLSKRKNPVSISQDFKAEGYLPEAMINFMVLLGWSPAKAKADEIYELEDLIAEFDLSEVGKSPAVFDRKKLDYLNGYYIRKMSLGELAKRCLPYLIQAGLVQKENEQVLKAMALVQERLKKLGEAPELTDFFFKKPQFPSELLVAKGSTKENALKGLRESLAILAKENDFSCDSLEALLRALSQKIGVGAGEILWPIRVALSGKAASPGAFELLEALGKKESLARIQNAADMLK